MTGLELGLVVLVAAAEHKKVASERSVEVELIEVGTGIRWVPAIVTVGGAGDEDPGPENFAVAPVKPEEGPEAEVVAEVGAFLEFAAAAAEEVQGSVLALAVDVGKARLVPVDATEDAWQALASGAVDVVAGA